MTDAVLTTIITAGGAALTGITIALINKVRNKSNAQKKEDEIAILGKQIYQCQILINFIPTWLIEESKYDAILADATDKELEIISTDLLQFINQSIMDHWSAEFFRTSYDSIPNVEALIIRFRKSIQEFKNDLESASKKKELLKLTWGTVLRQELFHLRRDALLIKEEAANLYNDCLAKMNSNGKVG